jgi:hypothetical protein
VLLLTIFLFALTINGVEWFSFKSKEQTWFSNGSLLTISSVTYNPSSRYSDWVPRIFGEEAIFHNRSYAKRAGAYLTPEEKVQRSKLFREHFQLPSEAILPSCSFEMLGYAVADYDHPISHYYMLTAPSIGVGSLTFMYGNGESDTWKCYYRAMYEFSAKKLLVLPIQHWPIFIYCPAPKHDHSCLNIHNWYKQSLLQMVMKAEPKNTVLENEARDLDNDIMQFSQNSFSTIKKFENLLASSIQNIFLPARLDVYLMHSKWSVDMKLDLLNMVRKPKSKARAICTVIPYTAIDPGRREINDAMAFDFIRYYNRLGFKVVMYDRDGINFNGIMSSPYSQLQRDDPKDLDLLYFNFTVLQRLIPGIDRFEAENVDSIKLSKVVVRGDIDKRLTYTYCRTHLRQSYGIEDVLIADYDEFLYCPRASATTQGQRQFLDEYLDHMKGNGVEQLFFKQRVLVPAAASYNMTQCLQEQVDYAVSVLQHQDSPSSKTSLSEAQRPSIFHCLSPFEYGVKMFFDKAIHFGNPCPYTSFHFASYLRFVDCYANSFQSSTRVRRNYNIGGCSLIHVTSRPNHYNRTHPFNVSEARAFSNELIYILNEPTLRHKE